QSDVTTGDSADAAARQAASVTRPGSADIPMPKAGTLAVLSGPLPQLAADDPRIELCKRNLNNYTADQLESLHQHLVNMFNEVTVGHREGFMSEFETNTVREFYAAFCLALDSFKSESGRYKTNF